MTTTAPATLQDLFDEVTTPLGFEVIAWEWAGQGKYRVLRLYIDALPASSPDHEASQDLPPATIASPDQAPDQGAVTKETEVEGSVASSVTLQDCSSVSRLVGLALDAAEEDPRWAGVAATLKAAYTLEVSSPGIERPLTKVEHFARFVGQVANIRCERDLLPGQNRKKFCGSLLGVTTDGPEPKIRLMDEDLNQEVGIPVSVIKKAHLVYRGRI